MARGLFAIHQDIRVMHQPFVSRANLHGLEPARAIHWCAKHKIPVIVRPAGWQRECLGRFDDHVWFPELPAFCELRYSRQVGGIAFDCALFDPFLNARDFVIREAQLIREFRLPGFGQPWRHKAAPCHRGNLPGVRFSIDISEQWKRCGLAWPMALCARVIKDRGNVAIKRD